MSSEDDDEEEQVNYHPQKNVTQIILPKLNSTSKSFSKHKNIKRNRKLFRTISLWRHAPIGD